ncbi:YciI family protein [Trinickia violacea]|uniref:YciI family protein n=1 Tax=Trinickia violacea TaxID=2571746 RepID=A0A4P8IHB6_9BURK|nr:YciI family protein [Trinickia violacea]QCP48028.1 YciI family protein [Trinickia violacea]
MRFMIMVKATATSESGAMPDESLIAAMATYHEELAKAGVLLDATGLQPSSKGWRVRYSGGKRTIVDGPFAETKELIAGYTLIQVRSREEAMEWARRFPAPFGEMADGEIEVRPLFELEDFEPSDAVERFRDLDAARRDE